MMLTMESVLGLASIIANADADQIPKKKTVQKKSQPIKARTKSNISTTYNTPVIENLKPIK